jgi:peptidoglycan/xylan/chitin deacetylase (PgdA/CDA1 family)
MSTYIPAYDTEQDACLAGATEIARVHEAFEIPATLFVVAKLLENQGDDSLALIGNHPLFEIASHSYTHMLLRDHLRSVNPAGPTDQHHREIV